MTEEFYNNVDEILEAERTGKKAKPFPQWDNPDRHPWIFKPQNR